MRKIMLVAAILATLGMGSQLAEARNQAGGGRHFSAHAGVKFHGPHHDVKQQNRRFFGKSGHFPSFGYRDFVFRFENYGGFVSKFHPLPRFRADHLHGSRLKHHRPRSFTNWHHRPRSFTNWHHRPRSFTNWHHPPRSFTNWHQRGFGKPWHALHRKTPNR